MNAVRLVVSLLQFVSAYVLSLLVSKPENIVVLGSNYGGRADPNLVFMRNYLLSRDYTVYVVSNNPVVDDPDRLSRGSIVAALRFLQARACLYTHSISDIVPVAHKLSFLKRLLGFPKLIFLQHGVIGLKSKLAYGSSMSSYIRSLSPTFDCMVVSSDRERQIVTDFGIAPNKLVVTGLPRFDAYPIAPDRDCEPQVLVFFTWQQITEFNRKIQQVMESKAIKLLRYNGYRVSAAIHDMQAFRDGEDMLASEELSAAIQRCDILITDDSSAAWDVLYKGDEVLFYQPSESWLRDDPELRLRRCANEYELLLGVRLILTDNAPPAVNDIASFRDNANCQRVEQLLR